MLILSRRVGERVRVGPDVWVTVTEVERGRVRIGFSAPLEVRIEREELLPPEQRFRAVGEPRRD